MAKKLAHIGEMDRRIEVFKTTIVATETASREKQDESLGSFWAKLIDVSGTQEVEGQVISLAVRKYVLRYQDMLLLEGVTFFLKDTDGTFNIHSVEQEGRREFLVLKTSKRE